MFWHRVDDKVSLKLLTLEDAEAVFHLTDASRSVLRAWLPWVDGTRSVEDSRSFIRMTLQQFAQQNGFQAGVYADGALAGCIGFHAIDWANRTSSVGYWLGTPFQGQGLMTRAVRAALDIAFTEYGLNRMEIRAAVENQKSRAIPERLGFVQEGIVRDAEWLGTRYVDHVVYGMLKRDWRMA